MGDKPPSPVSSISSFSIPITATTTISPGPLLTFTITPPNGTPSTLTASITTPFSVAPVLTANQQLVLLNTTVSGSSASSSSSSSSSPGSSPGFSSGSSGATSSSSSASSHSTSSPSNNQTSRSHHSSNEGISAGAVSGIAIGAAAAASILTFLVAFLIIRRRKAPRHDKQFRDKDDYTLSAKTRDRKQDRSKRSAVVDSSDGFHTVSKLDSHFQPSEDDSTIRNDVLEVWEQIDIHVDNYYKSSAISVPTETRAEIETLSPSDSQMLIDLLNRSSNCLPVIKHILTAKMLARIAAEGDPEATFLPRDYVTFPSTLERLKLSNPQKSVVFSEAFSRWRVLTSHLYADPDKDNNYVVVRDHNISDFIGTVSRAFKPWIDTTKSTTARTRQMKAILENAAGKGIMFFSQPSQFEFSWGVYYSQDKRQLVVRPAMLKTVDAWGRRLETPQRMIERVVVGL
ncbi:MAG: hypothetical protein Q9160_008722 [Pyrenula sp. 1 TL-2023]